ncbi:MAG: formyltetrahydrofolate deformylase [Actinobacteria bacterium]|nr:formyltetrahydrofolate deformylase [Actinomycetota bacterium]
MDYIVTLQCLDQPGIVHAMTTAILNCDGNIIENQQFTDPITNQFVMRTRFESNQSEASIESTLTSGLSKFTPALRVRNYAISKKVLVMVTKESHCLRDLLFLLELGELPIEIPLVIGNRPDLRELVESHGITFEYLPFEEPDRVKQEAVIVQRVQELKIDFVVLARFMQILSAQFCQSMANSIINIHHSFLPSFKGAKPYHQAHEKGVKIIGATAHFVTEDLDEGPIIEQDVAHVNHSSTPEELIAIGRDIERRVLGRAVKYFAEDRIFIIGKRTVVFS